MRSRVVKPQFFKNEDLARLPDAAVLLFIGLWCLADRDGRLEDRPAKIKAEVRPYSDCDIDELLDQLHNHHFIQRYEAEGRRCIQVVSWTRHGNPHPKEPSLELPEPTKDAQKPCKKMFLHGELRSSLPSSSSFSFPNPAAGKPRRGRARDELFDVVAEVTASDPKASGSYIGRVCKALRSADPPYTAAEVLRLVEIAPVELPWLKGRLTLGLVEQFIGRVRASPLTPKVTKSAFEEALRRHKGGKA
jgi:hypothetical protein